LISVINATGGEIAIADGVYVPLTVDPNYSISVVYGTGVGGTTHVLIDVTGYFQ